MRYLLLAVLIFNACDAPTENTRATINIPPGVHMGTYDASRPAPSLISAVRTGGTASEDVIDVTLVETAIDATLVSAYATGITAPATQNIIPSGALNTHTETIVLAGPHATLQLRYMWGTLPGDGSDIVWGPWSNVVAITDAAPIAPASEKGKGHNK